MGVELPPPTTVTYMGVSLREKRRMLSPRAIHLRIARPARRALGRRGSGTRGTMHTVDFRFAEDSARFDWKRLKRSYPYLRS